ncbi:hypothetical protein BH10PSE7_BH10PSE7_42290 [soil metagenome]
MRKLSCVIAILVAVAALTQPTDATSKRRAVTADTPQKFLCSIIDAACKKKSVPRSKKTSLKKRSKHPAATKRPSSTPARAKAAAPDIVPAKPLPSPPPKAADKEPPPVPKPLAKPPHAVETPPEKPAGKLAPDAQAPPKPIAKPSQNPEPPRPAETGPVGPNAPVIPAEKPQPAKPVPEPPQGAAREEPSAGEAAACRAALTAHGVTYTIPALVEGDGVCSVANPVQLTSVETKAGTVELPGHPVLNCAFALQFTTWLADVAGPTIGAQGEARLAALSTGPGYQCRGRNGDASNRTSEHAFGNAIDVDGIMLADKHRIAIEEVTNPQNAAYRLLMALRISACGYFSTVLGPGSNAAHATHYHFDLGVHGKSSNYRICE